MFVDSISLFASLDRSLPQDSDTLRFVQQCLGGMGLKPDSISARGQWIQIWWVLYAFISLMDPAWVSWILRILRILRTSDVDSGSTWLCDTHTHILILVLYCADITPFTAMIDARLGWYCHTMPYWNAWSETADVTGALHGEMKEPQRLYYAMEYLTHARILHYTRTVYVDARIRCILYVYRYNQIFI